MSQAASSVLTLVDNPNTGPRVIKLAIEKDPAITAKILKVANSAYYGGVEMPTVGRAIHFLGINKIRSLVVGIAFQQMMGDRFETPGFCKVEFWKHSLAVATASRILARMKMPSKAEELFCAGMMHDVGMLVMDRYMPNEFQRSLELCQKTGWPLHEVEKSVLGYDHATVGGVLADKWNLSKVVRHAIMYHHSPELDGDYYETTCIIAASDVLAHQCGYTNNVDNVKMEINEEVAEAIGLPIEQFETVQAVVVSEVSKAQQAYNL